MRREDRGAATVLLACCVMVAVTVTLAGAAVARFAVARAEVSAAADMAALDAATGTDCRRAERTATANGAALASCRIEGPDVVVSVARDVELVPGRSVRVTAWARAGPP